MQRSINKSEIAIVDDKMIITTEYTDTLSVDDITIAISKNKEKQEEVKKILSQHQSELQRLQDEQAEFEKGLRQIINKE